jgi:hypothetical protein
MHLFAVEIQLAEKVPATKRKRNALPLTFEGTFIDISVPDADRSARQYVQSVYAEEAYQIIASSCKKLF